jgi:tetratricopeptide (TPR) repeat protein
MISIGDTGSDSVGCLGAFTKSHSCLPGKGVLLLLCACGLDAQYVGSNACRHCHSERFAQQSHSAHARALSPAQPGSVGQWAFGAGEKAITYVSRTNEDLYVEHGLSYYASTQALGPTPGHKDAAALPYPTLAPGASVARCFRCHSTGPLRFGAGFAIEPAEDGVRCEACHGQGADHVKVGGGASTIGNPKRLNAVELNQFCGVCHRRPPEAGEVNDGRIAVGLKFDWSNSWNTRHQPAYLSQSACFRGSAGALSCLTCHDPHDSASHSAAAYDRRCIACHDAVRHRTATAGTACVTCHMPSVRTTPEMHFTNHWIGVYAKENPLVPVSRAGHSLPPLALEATGAGRQLPPNDPSSLRPLFEEAVADRQKQLGPTDPKVARSAATLGLFLKETGYPAAAEPPLRQALEIDRANHSTEAPGSEEELGQILETIGKRNEAVELFRQAAAGADARVSALSYASLARLDPAKAAMYYESAVTAEEIASGKDSPRVAAQLSNLALALRGKGDLKAAEPLLRRALSIQERALGRSHYQTATTLSNLGGLLQGIGQLAEAESLEYEALAIFEQKRPQSLELAAVSANLADLLTANGDRAAAADLLRRAIAIDEAVGGSETLEIAADLASLGVLLRHEGNTVASDPLLRRALAIFEARLGPNSPPARDIRQTLIGAPH